MRIALTGALTLSFAIAALGAVQAKDQAPEAGDATKAFASARSETPRPTPPKCDNPKAMGVSRTVEIDTKGGPGFGFEHFKMYDFLRPKEVVLTFDDGPWPHNTPAVLKALADECLKATFFPIGKHAIWHPEILKQVAAAGHTIGSHTWSHKDLSKLKVEEAKEEVEMGISAIKIALNRSESPFFRFPALRHPPEMVKYMAERNIGIFSTDIDSFDFKIHRPHQLVKSVMHKLDKRGKGIILMHDFQRATAEGLPELLKALKAGGYKVVHMTAKGRVTSIEKYDEEMIKKLGPGVVSERPLSSVVKTISE